MGKEMERVEKFERTIEKEENFIQGATNYIYEHIEDPTTSEIIECSRAINLSNARYLNKEADSLAKLRQTMASVAPITISIIQPLITPKKEKRDTRKLKSIQELIDHITYSQLDNESIRILESQSHEDIVRLKLHFYKLILETKKAIREACLNTPLADIKELQSNLETYLLILDIIKEAEQKEQIDEIVTEEKEYSNIIFAPNGKRSTYILDDISQFPDKSKEIKLIMDKLVDGYFLKTKDTKSIEGYQENLYEYRHPNGIRVLYVVEGNIIIICSLFMKDKQKSTRITNEYDEAISRYHNVREYVTSNFTNPDFHVEQSELIGEIYQTIDVVTISKKVGDE